MTGLLLALLQVAAAGPPLQVEISTAATSVVVTGSRSARTVTVTTSDGVSRPSVSTVDGVTTIRDANPSSRVVAGEYRIEVPEVAALTLRVRCVPSADTRCPNATVRIADVAAVLYESVDGNATITRIAGNVKAASLYGTVTVSDVRGSVDAASQTNAVNVSDVRGRVTANSTTGMMSLRSIVGGATATNTTGEVKLSGTVGPSSQYEINTDLGHIRLDLAAGTGATVEVNAPADAVRIRAAGARMTSSRDRRRTIVLGNGGAAISARTLQGGVDIGARR